MSIYSDKLAHIQFVFNCLYSVSQWNSHVNVCHPSAFCSTKHTYSTLINIGENSILTTTLNIQTTRKNILKLQAIC